MYKNKGKKKKENNVVKGLVFAHINPPTFIGGVSFSLSSKFGKTQSS